MKGGRPCTPTPRPRPAERAEPPRGLSARRPAHPRRRARVAGRAPAEGIAPELTRLGRSRVCCERRTLTGQGFVNPAGVRHPDLSVGAAHAAPPEAAESVIQGGSARCRVRVPDDLHCCVAQSGRATPKGVCRRFESFPTNGLISHPATSGRKTIAERAPRAPAQRCISGGRSCAEHAGLRIHGQPRAPSGRRRPTRTVRSGPRHSSSAAVAVTAPIQHTLQEGEHP